MLFTSILSFMFNREHIRAYMNLFLTHLIFFYSIELCFFEHTKSKNFIYKIFHEG